MQFGSEVVRLLEVTARHQYVKKQTLSVSEEEW